MRRGMDHLSFSRESRPCLVVGVCCGGGSGRSCCIWCEGRIKSLNSATVSGGSGAALRGRGTPTLGYGMTILPFRSFKNFVLLI